MRRLAGRQEFTRHGLEEYVSDRVILLDNRVSEQVSIRRIRVIKYRGSNHGTNEYPFVIDTDGLAVIPITSSGLDQPGTRKRITTGMPSLDKLFQGPLTSLIGEGNQREIRSLATCMIDLLKSKGVSGLFTSLVSSTAQNYTSGEVGVSSLIDTWVVVREPSGSGGGRRARRRRR